MEHEITIMIDHKCISVNTKLREENFPCFLLQQNNPTRYLGENSCKSFTAISTPTAPNRIVSSCDYIKIEICYISALISDLLDAVD